MSLTKSLIGLAPLVAAVIAESRKHPDPRRALRTALAAMAAERAAHAGVDAMIAARAKAKPPIWE